jgi:hypothetical protein
MANLSRKTRKIIGETVRRTIANLGLVSPQGLDNRDYRQDHAHDERNPEQPPQKSSFDIISEFITIGIGGVIFTICWGGITGFFSQYPQILNVCSWVIGLLILFGGGKMVFYHKRHWMVLVIAILGSGLICISAWRLVENKKAENALAKNQRQEERGITTNIPTRFDTVDARLADVGSKIAKRESEIKAEAEPEIIAKLKARNEKFAGELSDFFPYGYVLFTAKEEHIFIPPQTQASTNVDIQWGSGCALKLTPDMINVTIPKVVFGLPNSRGTELWGNSFWIPRRNGEGFTLYSLRPFSLIAIVLDTNENSALIAYGFHVLTNRPPKK